jgi:alpha-1,2-mannosyltransferase
LLLGAPILVHYVFFFYAGDKHNNNYIFTGLFNLIKCLIIYGVLILAALVVCDSYMYGRLVLAPLNIVLYNVLNSGEHGPELYGVEPFSYYVKNLLLNLNVTSVLAIVAYPLLSLFLLVLRSTSNSRIEKQFQVKICLAYVLGLVAWLVVLGTRPHKEERFMYPVYPLVLILAACSLSHLHRIVASLLSSRFVATAFVFLVLVVHAVLSTSRFTGRFS